MLTYLTYLKNWFQSFQTDEEGQTMVEYALLLALIAVVVAAAIPALTSAITGMFTTIETKLGA